MSMDPSMAVGPTQQAPADRPSLGLEQVLRQAMALMFGDNKLDQNEMGLLRDFFEEVSLRAQQGGIGQGGTPPAGMEEGEVPQTPGEMNMNTQDQGTVEGAEPEFAEGY